MTISSGTKLGRYEIRSKLGEGGLTLRESLSSWVALRVRTVSGSDRMMYQRPPYPDYWLMSSSERALSTNVGTNRINWDLRYDDPPGYIRTNLFAES